MSHTKARRVSPAELQRHSPMIFQKIKSMKSQCENAGLTPRHLPRLTSPEDGALHLPRTPMSHELVHVRERARARARARQSCCLPPLRWRYLPVAAVLRRSALLSSLSLSFFLSFFLSRFRTQRLASSSLPSTPPIFSTSFSSSLRMPQPRAPGPASRQMVAPSPATLDSVVI